MHETKSYSLFNNSRFYVLLTAFLLSVLVFAGLRVIIPSDQLFYIRAQQVFGMLAILYWYGALIISPLGYMIGKNHITHVAFARRAIGVSAAYFALLHFAIAFFGQLGGFGALNFLPSIFQWSIIGGGAALVILLLMASTSFDVVIRLMTFRWWKWLHRLGYVGLILVILHIWTVGTHVSYSGIQITAFVMLGVLAGLESYRMATVLAKRYKELQSKDYFYAIFIALWIVWLVAIACIPAITKNYHSEKHTINSSSSEGHVNE